MSLSACYSLRFIASYLLIFWRYMYKMHALTAIWHEYTSPFIMNWQKCNSVFACLNMLLLFTNALCSHFAVSIRALASKWALCIDALLTGLAVMFIPFTLIHICESIRTIHGAGYMSHIRVHLCFLHICCYPGIFSLQRRGLTVLIYD